MATTIPGDNPLLQGRKNNNPVIAFFAHFFSYIFHPLFIPFYVTVFLVYIHPYTFIALSEKGKVFKLLFVAVNTMLFPALSVFLMWRLKLTQSIFLRTQRERIIPYAAAMIFYFWAWYVSKSQQDSNEVFTTFLFGSFLAVIAAWLANIYFKISMHTLAMGGMLVFIFWVSFSGDGSSGLYPSMALLITGIVCTARMIVSDHHPVEIYSGLVVGILCQLIAMWV